LVIVVFAEDNQWIPTWKPSVSLWEPIGFLRWNRCFPLSGLPVSLTFAYSTLTCVALTSYPSPKKRQLVTTSDIDFSSLSPVTNWLSSSLARWQR